MVNVINKMWTSCGKKVEIIKKEKPKNKEMKVVRVFGIIYLLVGTINLGLFINFLKILNIV